MGYLVASGYSAKLLKSEFDKVSSIPIHKARKKVEKSFENQVIFTSTFNLRDPNVSQLINLHLHLIKNSPFLHNFFQDGSIIVANKRCQNLKDLSFRGDPYNIKHDLTDIVPHLYKTCGQKCDLCDNFVASQSYMISNATERKYYIRRDSTCSIPNVAYIAYCKKCKNEGFGSTISWKSKLRKYKGHIKNMLIHGRL